MGPERHGFSIDLRAFSSETKQTSAACQRYVEVH